MKTSHVDKLVITHLGGPTKLAKRLGLPSPGGVQRVVNWNTRGIPATVKLRHIDLFTRAERELKSQEAPAKPKRKAA